MFFLTSFTSVTLLSYLSLVHLFLDLFRRSGILSIQLPYFTGFLVNIYMWVIFNLLSGYYEFNWSILKETVISFLIKQAIWKKNEFLIQNLGTHRFCPCVHVSIWTNSARHGHFLSIKVPATWWIPNCFPNVTLCVPSAFHME